MSSDIAEFISTDGEVITTSDFNSEKEFQFKVLNSLDFENIKSFFVKKYVFESIKDKHKLTNGSNGVTNIELSDLFKLSNFQQYINELESKKIIEKRKGINLDMFFMPKK